MLHRFAGARIPLDGLVVTQQQNTPREAPPQNAVPWGRAVRRGLRARWQAFRRWPYLAARTQVAQSLADPTLARALVRVRPDLLILAGTGIVPPPILRIPSVATLNAHPGLLPWVRGVCPLEHALLRGVPLGATVHAVDEGIDTGPIIRRVLLPPGDGGDDRIALMRRLEDTAIDALTDVVAAILRGESLPLRAQASRHPYGSWVSNDERAKAVTLLYAGEARRLYDTWRAAAGGDVLPDDDAKLPGPER